MSRARFQQLLAELEPLNNEKVRQRAHALLLRATDRRCFDETSSALPHEALVMHAARMIVRAELLAHYAGLEKAGDRVSGVRGIPVARIDLVQRKVVRAG